jgi:hypothetical protein
MAFSSRTALLSKNNKDLVESKPMIFIKQENDYEDIFSFRSQTNGMNSREAISTFRFIFRLVDPVVSHKRNENVL